MATGDGYRRSGKSAAAFRTISEVAKELDIPAHVLRFWEGKFVQVKPMKRGGGRRYYRPEDIDLLRGIRDLLYTDGYTIKGVQKLLREGGVKGVVSISLNKSGTILENTNPSEPGSEIQEANLPTRRLDDTKRGELLSILSELENIRDMLKNAPR